MNSRLRRVLGLKSLVAVGVGLVVSALIQNMHWAISRHCSEPIPVMLW